MTSIHNNFREIADLYFECHVTIEPVFEEKLELAKEISKKYGFKVASLLMQKREEDLPTRSMYDTFMTGHGMSLSLLKQRLVPLVNELKENDFKVWRYKIEDTILDSRIKDILEIL